MTILIAGCTNNENYRSNSYSIPTTPTNIITIPTTTATTIKTATPTITIAEYPPLQQDPIIGTWDYYATPNATDSGGNIIHSRFVFSDDGRYTFNFMTGDTVIKESPREEGGWTYDQYYKYHTWQFPSGYIHESYIDINKREIIYYPGADSIGFVKIENGEFKKDVIAYRYFRYQGNTN